MCDFIVRHITYNLPDGGNATSGGPDLARRNVAYIQNESEGKPAKKLANLCVFIST